MSRVLLDTTYLVDAERSGTDLDQAIDDEDDVAIAAITVAELRVGALLATGKRRTARSAFVDDVVRALDVVDYFSGVRPPGGRGPGSRAQSVIFGDPGFETLLPVVS